MVLFSSQMENQTVLDFDVLLIEVDFECTLHFSKNAWIMNEGKLRFSSWTDVLLILFYFGHYKGIWWFGYVRIVFISNIREYIL